MYTGTINKKPTYTKNPFRFKMQMVETETIEANGAITENYVFKTKEFKTDYNIRVRDFDILNLKAINALNQLQDCRLTKSIDMVQREAEQANQVMEEIEFIQNVERNQNNEQQV